jgi:DNA (cytosine-5)-methyltransferase 1
MKGKMNARNSPKVMDLFAGCGGLSLGLEFAGFYPVFVNELNDHARETYVRNRLSINKRLADPGFQSADVKSMLSNRSYMPALKERLKDAYRIDKGELDLIVGGPPCQGFSGIGHRRSYAVDKRDLPSNHLFRDMARIVEIMEPRAFLFENVRGLLAARWTAGGPKVWPDVLKTFTKLKNYCVAYQVVYAKHYGVPQNRPRILLVGVHRDLATGTVEEGKIDQAVARGFLPEPREDGYPHPEELLSDLVVNPCPYGEEVASYPKDPEGKWQRWFRTPRNSTDPLPANARVTDHKFSKHSGRVLERFRLMREQRDLPPELKTRKFAQRVLPSVWGAGGPTITATSLPDDYVHYEQDRILTVREWARLQTFPDWYEFHGPRTTGGLRRAGNPREGVFERDLPRYTQIGNAVPVRLAWSVGERLTQILGYPGR